MKNRRIIIYDNIEEDDPMELSFSSATILKEVINEYLNQRDWSVDHHSTYEDLVVVKKSFPRQPLSSNIRIEDLAQLHHQQIVELLVIAPTEELFPLIEVHFKKEIFYTVERYNKHEKLSRFLKCGLPGLQINQFDKLIVLVNHANNYQIDQKLIDILEKEGHKKLIIEIHNKQDYHRGKQNDYFNSGRQSLVKHRYQNKKEEIINKKHENELKALSRQKSSDFVFKKQNYRVQHKQKRQIQNLDQEIREPKQKMRKDSKLTPQEEQHPSEDCFFMTLIFETLLNGNTQKTIQIATPLTQTLQTFFPTILSKITPQGFDWLLTDIISKDNLQMLLDGHIFSIWNKSFRQLQFRSKANYLFKLKRNYSGG